MFNFIQHYVDYYKHRESPHSFWYWSALGCLSSVLRGNVYLDIPGDYIMPNMYIILLADSGIYRKAAPCKALAGYLREIGNTKLIEGRASIQAVIRELGLTTTDEKGNLLDGASGVMYSEELSSFCINDPATVPLLIDLYDYHEKWTNSLVTNSRVELNEVCLSLFAASNSSLFRNVYVTEAKEGGLLGRTLIIRPDQKRPRKSLLQLRATPVCDKQLLVDHLKRLKRMKGPVVIDSEGSDYYDEWYESIPEQVFDDKIGYGSRLGTHVFKVALAIASARADFNMDIRKEDIVEAIENCMILRKNYTQLVVGMGISTQSQQVAIVLQHLLTARNHKLTRATLAQYTIGDIERDNFDAIMEYLELAELIAGTQIGSAFGYKLTYKALQLLGESDAE